MVQIFFICENMGQENNYKVFSNVKHIYSLIQATTFRNTYIKIRSRVRSFTPFNWMLSQVGLDLLIHKKLKDDAIVK